MTCLTFRLEITHMGVHSVLGLYGSRSSVFEDPGQMLFSLGNLPDWVVIPFSAIPRASYCIAIIFLLLQEQEPSICQQSINACLLQARNRASFFQIKQLMQSLQQPVHSHHTYEDLGLSVICVVRGKGFKPEVSRQQVHCCFRHSNSILSSSAL